MERKRYLIITEKPWWAKQIKDVYDAMGDKTLFDADFASANCHVVDVLNTCDHFAGGKILDLVNGDTWIDEDGNVGVVEKFCLKNREVSDEFRVLRGGTYEKNMSENIRNLVTNNHYDAIVNACEACEEGNLKFQYAIESLGLEKFTTKRMYLFGPCMNNIEDELMLLNEN